MSITEMRLNSLEKGQKDLTGLIKSLVGLYKDLSCNKKEDSEGDKTKGSHLNLISSGS